MNSARRTCWPMNWMVAALAVATLLTPRPAQATWSNSIASGNNFSMSWSPGSDVLTCPDNAGGFWVGTATFGSNQEYAFRHVDATGWTDPYTYVASDYTTNSSKTNVQAIADGYGSWYVVWQDSRNSGDIYAQRYNSAGTRQWSAGGVALCSLAGSIQRNPVAARSNSGLIVGWTDLRNGDADIYAQQVNVSGAVTWAANGVPVSVVAGSSQDGLAIAAPVDSYGGAMFAWQDGRNSITTGVDIYATRVWDNGSVVWGTFGTGVAVGSATGNAGPPRILTVGYGLFVTWDEDRSLGTASDIYAQRLSSAYGNVLFTATGVTVCSAAGTQAYPVLTEDGLGGVIIAWEDSRNTATLGIDLYAQRVGAGGAVQWTANGVGVTNATDAQTDPQIVSDGANGAVLAWTDNRTGFHDIYARRLLANGAATWTSNGSVVCSGDFGQDMPSMLSDGAGGAFIAFGDQSGYTFANLYGQHIDRFGFIGTPGPTIDAVRDVPNDQGGFVRLSWYASYLDALPNNKIDEYWVWREAPAWLSAQALAAARGDAMIRAVPTAVGTVFWERIAVVPATALAGYSVVTATTADSIGGSNLLTRFQVEAHQYTTEYFWASAEATGYSVDNLGPAAPVALAALYAGGTTRLHWLPNHEADLAGYELYRGSSSAFVPSPATLVAAQPDTGYADAAGGPYVYKLLALDVHGNRSPVATLVPSGTLDAPGGGAVALFLAPASPNPARDGTTLRFGLVRGGVAKLAVYDAAGRLVRVLHSGALPAGEHAVRWDTRGADGRTLAPGLYLARLDVAGAASLVRRIVVTR